MMMRLRFAILTGLVLAGVARAQQPPMRLGATLDETHYHNTTQLTTDLFLLAARMNPGKDPARFIIPTEGYVRPGEYILTAEGKGVLEVFGARKFTGQGERHSITLKTPRGQRTMLTVASSDPADPIRKIRFMPAGADPNRLFNPAYMEKVADLEIFRSLHFYNVEGDARGGVETDWSTAEPWRWSLFIELCNQAGARPWVCIPHMATADYCEQLGKLFAAELRPGLVPYLEYSNEIWNNAHPFAIQTGWVRDQGKLIGLNNYREAYAEFTNRAFVAFQAGYGRESVWTQCGQLFGEGTITASLGYAKKKGYRVDMIASAPYVNPRSRVNATTPNPKIDFRVLGPMWLAAKGAVPPVVTPPVEPPPVVVPPVEPPPVVTPPVEPPPVVTPPVEPPPVVEPKPGTYAEGYDAGFGAGYGEGYKVGYADVRRREPPVAVAPRSLAPRGIEGKSKEQLLAEIETIVIDACLSDIPERMEPQMKKWKAIADANGVRISYYEWGQGLIWTKGDVIQEEIGTYIQRSAGMGRVVEKLYEVSSKYSEFAIQTGFIGPWGGAQWFGIIEYVDDRTPKGDAFFGLAKRAGKSPILAPPALRSVPSRKAG